MRRRLRERPRLVSAQLTLAAVVLAAALLAGFALAGDNRERETRLEQRLASAHAGQHDQHELLARQQADNERIKRELVTLRRASRRQARVARALHTELDGARRALRRARE